MPFAFKNDSKTISVCVRFYNVRFLRLSPSFSQLNRVFKARGYFIPCIAAIHNGV